MKASSRDLAAMPASGVLRSRCIALAAIDIILSKDASHRYHTYEPRWSPGVDLVRIDTGSGDHLFIAFAAAGTVIKGFDHESSVSQHMREDGQVWPGMYDGVPPALLRILDEPTLMNDDVTFCLWTTPGNGWRSGRASIPSGMDDGSEYLLGLIHDSASESAEWIAGYYEVEVPPEALLPIFRGGEPSDQDIRLINPTCDPVAVRQELRIRS